jgi:hypothetical protein
MKYKEAQVKNMKVFYRECGEKVLIRDCHK